MKTITLRSTPLVLLLSLAIAGLFAGCQLPPQPTPRVPLEVRLDQSSQWTTNTDGRSSIRVQQTPALFGDGLEVTYELRGDHGYVELVHAFPKPYPPGQPVSFFLKAKATGNLELKLADSDGSTFWRKLPLNNRYTNWTSIVVGADGVEYGWGGNDHNADLSQMTIALAGQGKGTVWLNDIGVAPLQTSSTLPPVGPWLDPNRELPGLGFAERRDAALHPEDPLVLEWMKQVQDSTTPDKNLLGSMEDSSLQTFNNALAAAAFIVKGEKERAERILDFFANATDRTNNDPKRQNFFYNGEARGFFQNAVCKTMDGRTVYLDDNKSDRWMGDMVWLMYAYKYYDQVYGRGRYNEIESLIHSLLISYYTDAPDGGPGGYLRHGWIKGDSKLHEPFGHHEGNIDAYAYFKLIGDDRTAGKIRAWLDRGLKGNTLPLDLYSWRVMAFGKEAAEVLNIPDYDLRYRKTVEFNGKTVVGFWSSADGEIQNIWCDGVGHMACAYFAVGQEERGNFYANQMDGLLVDREINGVKTRGLPYTANHTGGSEWVDTDRGFVSVAAWYIFAKNRFNLMTLRTGAD